MKTQEVLDILSELEADNVAMKRIKDWERLKEYIKGAKWSANHLADMNYKAGYMCALSFVEGAMAEMENEDGEN